MTDGVNYLTMLLDLVRPRQMERQMSLKYPAYLVLTMIQEVHQPPFSGFQFSPFC